MLRCEQCSRNKDCNLLAVLHALECCAHSDFGFTKSNIAAHKPIHRHASFHVCFDKIYCGALIGCFDKRECTFHFVLPWRVLRKCMTNGIHSTLVQHYELLSDLANRRANSLFRPRKVAASKAVQGWLFSAYVLTHPVDVIRWYIQLVAVFVRQQQIVTLGSADLSLNHSLIATNTVIVVHHVVARFEILKH